MVFYFYIINIFIYLLYFFDATCLCLTEQASKVPEWNFYKYLVGHDGVVLNAWGTRTEIEEIFPEVQAAVSRAKAAAARPGTADQQQETVPEKPEEITREEL